MNRFRKISLIIAFFLLISLFPSCSASQKYNENWIIGKTYSEIIERYGEFDICLAPSLLLDGECYNTGCGYLTKQPNAPYDSVHDEFYMIYFDSYGLASSVKENYMRPGG